MGGDDDHYCNEATLACLLLKATTHTDAHTHRFVDGGSSNSFS